MPPRRSPPSWPPELLDWSHLDAPPTRQRDLRGRLDGLDQVPGLDQYEPAQLLLRLGERTVGGGQFAGPDPPRRCRLHGLTGLSCNEVAALPERVGVGH